MDVGKQKTFLGPLNTRILLSQSRSPSPSPSHPEALDVEGESEWKILHTISIEENLIKEVILCFPFDFQFHPIVDILILARDSTLLHVPSRSNYFKNILQSRFDVSSNLSSLLTLAYLLLGAPPSPPAPPPLSASETTS